jgi:hypothetical protein
MIVIIGGSRVITDYAEVCQAIRDSGFEITKIITGGARGVDRLGERYAQENGIPYESMAADWAKGRWAGFAHNRELSELGDALVAVYDGQSRGTAHMIDLMRKLGKPTFVRIV